MLVLVTGCCLFAGTTVGTQAYMVKGSDTLWNRFVPGNVAVAVTQTQGKTAVINKGTLGAWTFLEISVPQSMMRCVDPVTRKKTSEKKNDLITFHNNDGWRLLNQKEEKNQVTYTYGYERLLAPKEITEPLFDEISLVNYLEGELDSKKEWTVPVRAFAVQGSIARLEDGVEEAYRFFSGGDVR